MAIVYPSRHIIWSTEQIDISDPWQRRWYLRQVLSHGRSEDIRMLDLVEVQSELENLDLPSDIYSLWKAFLKTRYAKG